VYPKRWFTFVTRYCALSIAASPRQLEGYLFLTGVFVFWASFLSLSLGGAHAAILRLTWQDTSSEETGFKIERLNGSTYVQIATVDANTKSYSDSNLTAGVSYCYRVRAFNATGTSAPTNAACATAPNDPVVTPPPSSPPPSSTPPPHTPVVTAPPPVGKQWSDYLVSLKIRSSDNDALGVLFRYQDADNYYRFTWFAEGKYRRLEKRVGGVFQVLAQDSAVYAKRRHYALQISARGSQLNVTINGKTIFSVSDASFSQGTIGLYSYYNAGSHFDNVNVQDLATGSTLLADDFSDLNYVGWTIIDEGNDAGPSVWSAAAGKFVQMSNIGSTVDNGKLGTYALYTRGSWMNYRMTLKLRSSDDDRLGVIFRFQDINNYYRISWNQSSPGRRLIKRENGLYTTLAEDKVPYVTNQTYNFEIIAQGNALKVNIDGKPVFSVTDPSFTGGAVALYSSYNQGSIFENVLVEDLAAKTTLLSDNFNTGMVPGWKSFDDPGTDSGPSNWSAANGVLVQSSNIGSDAVGHPGTFLLY
jgi:3-keto-disaccharide hydrolase/Fibronectin type III domain